MSSSSMGGCRIPGCRKTVPAALAMEMLCTDHFLEHASSRATAAWESCHHGMAIEEETLDGLLFEAQSAAQALISAELPLEIGQQEKILEFLLCVADLHEFAAQNPGFSSSVN